MNVNNNSNVAKVSPDAVEKFSRTEVAKSNWKNHKFEVLLSAGILALGAVISAAGAALAFTPLAPIGLGGLALGVMVLGMGTFALTRSLTDKSDFNKKAEVITPQPVEVTEEPKAEVKTGFKARMNDVFQSAKTKGSDFVEAGKTKGSEFYQTAKTKVSTGYEAVKTAAQERPRTAAAVAVAGAVVTAGLVYAASKYMGGPTPNAMNQVALYTPPFNPQQWSQSTINDAPTGVVRAAYDYLPQSIASGVQSVNNYVASFF